MKKLIDVAAINAIIAAGQKTVCVDGDTLLTPAARDAIAQNGLTITEGSCPECEPVKACEPAAPAPETPAAPAQACTSGCSDLGNIDANLILKVLAKLNETGLLNGLISACAADDKPYCAETDPAGFKLVRGNTVKTEVLDTGDPAQEGKVKYQEVIGADDGSNIAAGFITIDNVDFGWVTECQEIYYIVDGVITVTIDGKVYEAKAGDSFFIKKGVTCSFGAKGLGKAFYATY